MTTRKRHSPEQVVRKLATADRMLGEGRDVADVCRELGIAEQTYYRWRNQFGGLKADDAKRLKDLERENSTLKRLLADAEGVSDGLCKRFGLVLKGRCLNVYTGGCERRVAAVGA